MPSFFSPVVADSRAGINVSFSAWESSTNTANNTSVVSWSVTVSHGGTYGFSGTTRSQAGYLYMNVGGHQVVNGAWLSLTKGRYPGDGVYSNSGSVTIQHNSDGSKKINYSCSISQGGGNYSGDTWTYAGKSGGTHGLTLSTLRSNATAPSNLTVSGGLGDYIQPGGTLTFQWTLGKDGNSNPINNYHLLVDNQTIIDNIPKSSNTVTFEVPNNWVRGQTYSFKIRASATYNNADSGTVSKKINILPEKPIIKLDGSIDVTDKDIGNYTSDQRITLTPGTIYNKAFNSGDGEVHKESSMASPSSEEQAARESRTIIEEEVIAFNTYSIYKYQTWDGLEYSPAAFVRMNPKPTFINNITPKLPGNERYDDCIKSRYYTSTFNFDHANKAELQNINIISKIETSSTKNGVFTPVQTIQVENSSSSTLAPQTKGATIDSSIEGKYWRVVSEISAISNGVNLTNSHTSQVYYYSRANEITSLIASPDTEESPYILNNFTNIAITPKATQTGDDTPYAKATRLTLGVEYNDDLGVKRTSITKEWPSTGILNSVYNSSLDISKLVPIVPYGYNIKVIATIEATDELTRTYNVSFIRVKKPTWGADTGSAAGVLNLKTDETFRRYSNYYTKPYLDAESIVFRFPRIINTQWNTANEKLVYYIYFSIGESSEKRLVTKYEQAANAGGTDNVSVSMLADAWRDFLIKHPEIGNGNVSKPLKENIPFKISVVGSNVKNENIYVDSDELIITERNSYIKILEPPYFLDKNSENLYLAGRHSYNIEMKQANGGTLPTEEDTPNNYYFKTLPTDTEDIMVNPDEHIVLKFKPALDYNENEINYRVLFNGNVIISKADVVQSNGYGYIFIPYESTLAAEKGVILNGSNIISLIAYDSTDVLGSKSTIVLSNQIFLTPTGSPSFYYTGALEVNNGVTPEGQPIKAGAKLGKLNLSYWGGSSNPVTMGNLYRKTLKYQTASGTIDYNPINTLTYTIRNKNTEAVELTKTITLKDDIREDNGDYVIYLDPEGSTNSEEKYIDFKIKFSTGFGTEENNLTYVTGEFKNFTYIPRKPLLTPRYQQLGINTYPNEDETFVIRCLSEGEKDFFNLRRADDSISININLVDGTITLRDGAQVINGILDRCSIDGGTY